MTYQFFSQPTKPPYDSMMAVLQPLAWWKLNDPVNSATAADSSGNGFTGTVNGIGITFGQAGPVAGDTAALFATGTGNISNASIGASIGTTCTAIIWAQPTGSTTPYQGFLCDPNAGFTTGFDLGYIGSTKQFIATSRGPTVDNETVGTVTAGQWSMCVVTWDGTNQTGYVNAVASTPQARVATLASASALQIGNRLSAEGNVSTLLGQIAIFSYALTAAQISDLYAAA